MLKRILGIVALLAMSNIAFAGKIVSFNPEVAISQSKIAQSKAEEYRAQSGYAQLRADFDSVNTELKELSKEFEKNKLTWGDEEKSEYNKKAGYLQADRKLVATKLQEEEKNLSQLIGKEIGPILNDIVKKYVQENDIDMVVAPGAVLWAKPELDITKDIITALDKAK